MPATVVALLDPPSPKSFGMVPILVQRSDGLVVLGLAGKPARPMSADEFGQLHAGGHARTIESVPLPRHLTNPVACWIGKEFAAEAAAVRAPELPDIQSGWFSSPQGWYQFAGSASAYGLLERWVIAAGLAATEPSRAADARRLAGLMNWTLPSHPVTLAVDWRTTPDAEAAKLLDFQLRVSGAGLGVACAAALAKKHQRTIDELRSGK